MTSIMGFGIIDPENFIETFHTQRDTMISRGIIMALWPLAEAILKQRLGKLGIIK